jgi:hypothetical protein
VATFFDRLRRGAEELAEKTAEGVERLQLERDLTKACTELGRQVVELADRGDQLHEELAAGVERVRSLRQKLAGLAKPERSP